MLGRFTAQQATKPVAYALPFASLGAWDRRYVSLRRVGKPTQATPRQGRWLARPPTQPAADLGPEVAAATTVGENPNESNDSMTITMQVLLGIPTCSATVRL